MTNRYYIQRVAKITEGLTVEANTEKEAMDLSDLSKYLWEEVKVETHYTINKEN